LFGRQVLYHRRKRDSNCYVGEQTKTQAKLVQNCPCIDSDFEWSVTVIIRLLWSLLNRRFF
jgi:hypothetical protein